MKSQEHTQIKFLALTALEEFWDTSQPILFLGEWCKKYERKAVWEGLNAEVLESTELYYANSYEAYEYAITIYEKLLPKIANWLNDLHGTQYSLKYWRLLVGPFLCWYTQVVYDRFLYLQAAFHKYADLETYGLSHQHFLTPINTNEFVVFALYSDNWNMQILTQILDLEFKKPIKYKTLSWHAEFVQRKANWVKISYKFRTKFLLYLLRIINKIRQSDTIGILDGFNVKDAFNLMLKSRFRILPIMPKNPINRGQSLDNSILSKKIDFKIRNQLLTIQSDDPLLKLVLATLPINFPLNFVEAYYSEVAASKKLFSGSYKLLLIEQLASYDQYKFLAGELGEKETKLLGYQHGGGYGMQRASLPEFLECQVNDFFISWGWSSDKNVIPASMPYIHKYLATNYRKEKKINAEEILWLATICGIRYRVAIHDWLISSEKYLEDQKIFYLAIEEKNKNKISMRLNPSSTNIDEIVNYLPKLKITLPKDRESFFIELQKAKVVVIDHPSTPFLFSLAFNIPTILFWDKEHWSFRDEAKPYLEALARVGIYYDSPEAAAKMLNKIAEDPYLWWYSKSVQLVREKFCNNFVRISPNSLSEWRTLLLNLNKLNNSKK